MRSRVIWRRSATAVGVYAATALGFGTTVVATRELGVENYARFAAVIAASTFFQQLLDLTIEEALVKFGFRYAEGERWGRLRRLFEVALAFKLFGGVVAGIVIVALAPLSKQVWGTEGVVLPMAVAALIAVAQSPENVAAGAIILRGRYDIRAFFLALSMAVRLVGLAVGCLYGVTGAFVGLLVTQGVATLAIGLAGIAAFRRFPSAAAEPIGSDVPELRRFVIHSSIASSLVSGRAALGTALMPVVAPLVQAGYFRVAQAPATGFAALSSPARLVLLTEQTRDFEAGNYGRMYSMLRRYITLTTIAMVVAVPVLWVAMPWIVGLVYGHEYRLHATTAARLVLLAAALQFVWGWTKSFPVSVGRPGLRVVAQAFEIVAFVPLLLVLGHRYGASGGAGAMLASTALFCALWVVLLARIRSSGPAVDRAPA
jgi:O-antigen/teichoic acid export membrane protein